MLDPVASQHARRLVPGRQGQRQPRRVTQWIATGRLTSWATPINGAPGRRGWAGRSRPRISFTGPRGQRCRRRSSGSGRGPPVTVMRWGRSPGAAAAARGQVVGAHHGHSCVRHPRHAVAGQAPPHPGQVGARGGGGSQSLSQWSSPRGGRSTRPVSSLGGPVVVGLAPVEADHVQRPAVEHPLGPGAVCTRGPGPVSASSRQRSGGPTPTRGSRWPSHSPCPGWCRPQAVVNGWSSLTAGGPTGGARLAAARAPRWM